MKFWGVEVKSGEAHKVTAGDKFLVHLSQACLGVVKKDKGSENVSLYVKVGDKKLALGALSPGKLPQLSFDLVFEQNFELSHSWKNGSVHFIGYQVPLEDEAMGDDSDEETGYDVPVVADVGKAELQGKQPKSEEEMDDSEDEEDDSSDDDEPMIVTGEYNDESENDESDDEDEETPKKVELGEKRSAGSVAKTPLPEKKAKFVTPQKTEEKKGVAHVATPHPSKHASKPSTISEQKQLQTQKPFACKSCGKSFGSDIALQSHTKDKHSGAR